MGHEATLPSDLRSRLLDALRTDAGRLLVQTLYAFSTVTRGEYAEAGNSPQEASSALRGANEVVIVIAKQLRQLRGEAKDGYPQDVLLDVLWETPGASRGALASAFQNALDSIDP
jgi:hypothetical protein